MGGTAQELYEEGIRQSMTELETTDASNVEAYITSANVPVAADANSPATTDIPVAFETDMERQLEQIATQKWIALYPDGWEAFAELRRTGYPKIYPLLNVENADLNVDDIFRRMTFVVSEISNNAEAVMAAESLLNGPNNNATKVWWDKK